MSRIALEEVVRGLKHCKSAIKWWCNSAWPLANHFSWPCAVASPWHKCYYIGNISALPNHGSLFLKSRRSLNLGIPYSNSPKLGHLLCKDHLLTMQLDWWLFGGVEHRCWVSTPNGIYSFMSKLMIHSSLWELRTAYKRFQSKYIYKNQRKANNVRPQNNRSKNY